MGVPVVGDAIRWFHDTGSLRNIEAPIGALFRGICRKEDPGIGPFRAVSRRFQLGRQKYLIRDTFYLFSDYRWLTGVSFLVFARALGFSSG